MFHINTSLTRLEYYIITSKPVQAITHWLKGIYLPGFEGVSLFDSLNFFRKQIFSNKFYSKASAVSFSFLMALPPLLLFFFTLIPYMPLPEQKIVSVMNEMLALTAPNPTIQHSISKIITNFITHKKNVLLSFSVLLTLYYSSNGMMGLMNTFEKQLPGFKGRNWFKQRVIALGLTLLLIISILFLITYMIFQSWVSSSLEFDFLKNLTFVKLVAYIGILIISLLTISFIYRYGTPSVKRLRIISPGAIIATLLITLVTQLFFYAVNNLVHYDKIYGSIGTLIIFMIWVNLVAQILLIGFELNASIIVNKKGNPEFIKRGGLKKKAKSDV